VNSVLAQAGITRGSKAPVSRATATSGQRPPVGRRVLPSWFDRAVSNSFGKVGGASLAGARPHN